MNDSSQKDDQLVRDIIARRGADFVAKRLNENPRRDVLTILANSGLHPIPENHVKGELYIASNGNLDFSNIETARAELINILKNLKTKLTETRWEEIYLIPFGHSVVLMNIKLSVFRTLRIETKDLFYFGDGKYEVMDIDTRKILVD